MNLELFENWIRTKVSHHSEVISSITFRTEWKYRSVKPAVEVVIETYNKRTGNIIFWDTGESDMWVFDSVSQKLENLNSIIVGSTVEFDKVFEDFFIKLQA